MSNLATVQSIYAAFGRGDIPAILDVLADDVQWESWDDNSAVKTGVPTMVPRHGNEQAVRFFEAAAQLKITELQVLTMMEGDNQVAVEFVLEADLLRHYIDTAKHIAAFGLEPARRPTDLGRDTLRPPVTRSPSPAARHPKLPGKPARAIGLNNGRASQADRARQPGRGGPGARRL